MIRQGNIEQTNKTICNRNENVIFLVIALVSRHSVHITMSAVHLFPQNETYLQLVKSALWCAIDQNDHKNISEG